MKTEEEPGACQEISPEVKVKEEEETGQEVVTTEESIEVHTTEENSNVAINYSQPTSVNQVVYQNDGSYIEYAYQVKIRPEFSTLIRQRPYYAGKVFAITTQLKAIKMRPYLGHFVSFAVSLWHYKWLPCTERISDLECSAL